MAKDYHERDLRKFRFSEPGLVYAITKNVLVRHCILVADPEEPDPESDLARIVCDSIRWHHERGIFRCWAFSVMPDHFHLVFKLEDDWSLQKTMKILCQFTAKEINEVRGRSGRFWQKGFYDRRIRTEEELENQLHYAYRNPVKAGLVGKPEDWPFGGMYPDW